MPVLTLKRQQYGINASLSIFPLPLIFQFVLVFHSIGKTSTSALRASKDMHPCTKWCDFNIQLVDGQCKKIQSAEILLTCKMLKHSIINRMHAPTELQNVYAVYQSYESCTPESHLSLLQLPSLHPSIPKLKYYYLERQLEY